jgi:hypothetical protein
MHAFASLLTNQRGTQARDLASPLKKRKRTQARCLLMHAYASLLTNLPLLNGKPQPRELQTRIKPLQEPWNQIGSNTSITKIT